MFYEALEPYRQLIADYVVRESRRHGAAHALVAEIAFRDGSRLFIKDFLFATGARRHSFHWQDERGLLQCRWDNSPNHPHLAGFPHHRHDTADAIPSRERSLADVLRVISERLEVSTRR